MFQCFQDTGREIDKLCSFLGFSPTPEDREKVITGVSFDSMKKNSMTNYSTAQGLDHKVSPFMRKGTFLLYFFLSFLFFHMKMWSSSGVVASWLSMSLKEKLVIGRTISPWPRMRCLTNTTSRRWRIQHCSFAVNCRALLPEQNERIWINYDIGVVVASVLCCLILSHSQEQLQVYYYYYYYYYKSYYISNQVFFKTSIDCW